MVKAGDLGADPRRAGGIRAGLARHPRRGDRQQAGRMAHGSGPLRPRRRGRRHRHPCLQPRRVHRRRRGRLPLGGAPHLRGGPPARRQCAYDAALRFRRQGHALVQPGGIRHRERPAHPHLRREGGSRMASGEPELPDLLASRRAAAHDPPQRLRRRRGSLAPPRASRADIRKAISRASPSSTPMWPSRSRPGSRSAIPIPSRFRCRPSTTACAACASSKRRCAPRSARPPGSICRHCESPAPSAGLSRRSLEIASAIMTYRMITLPADF